MKTKDTNKEFAITSMICGIAGFVFCWVPFLGSILAILALIFGIVSLAKKESGKWMAIVGIVAGGLAFVCSIGLVLMLFNKLESFVDGLRKIGSIYSTFI